MRPVWRAAAAVVSVVSISGVSIRPVPAHGQNAPIQTTQLPPLQEQQPGSSPVQQVPIPQAPFSQAPVPQAPIPQTPAPPALPGPGAQSQGQGQTPPPAPPVTFDQPNVWVPASAVKLEALDKVNAQARELTIKVGQSATFGSLTITVKACVIRPPDQPADAAAYLQVTDSHPDSPSFDGWMLEDEPSVSMLQHPIYDLRVAGCA